MTKTEFKEYYDTKMDKDDFFKLRKRITEYENEFSQAIKNLRQEYDSKLSKLFLQCVNLFQNQHFS